MRKKTRVTIGIPAYNEEENLRHLLADLSRQELHSCVIESVHVVSDASTDRTEQVARGFKQYPVKLTVHSKRQGIAVGLNDILSASKSDVVVILNADVWVKDHQCIEKLIAPIVFGNADLTSCNLISAPSTTWVGDALESSMRVKTRIFEKLLSGDNIYGCHGTARAFSKRLAGVLRFPHSIGEDAYSYLFAVKNGFRFTYVRETFVYYALPQFLADHFRQSSRFEASKRLFVNEFGDAFVQSCYALPFTLQLYESIHELIWHPISYTLYNLIRILSSLSSWVREVEHTNAWSIATSSKVITRTTSHNKV